MGFSTVAASIILFAGFLFLSSVVANTMLEAQRDNSEAERDKELRDQALRSTAIDLDSANWQGQRLHVYLINDGDSVLEVEKIQVFMDGVYSTDQIQITRVDGVQNIGFWAPGQELYLRIQAQPKPDRTYIVTENGVGITVIV